MKYLFAILLASCLPAPVPPAPDASDASVAPPPKPDMDVATQACASLHVLGCPEGDDMMACVDTWRRDDGNGINLHAACVASAMSQNGARSCGVKCVKK